MRITADMLERYLQGKCTDEEKKLISEWLENNETPSGKTGDFPEEAIWERLQNSLGETALKAEKRSSRKIKAFAVAATLAAVMFIPVYLYIHNEKNGRLAKASDIQLDSIVSGPNDRKSVTLSDGTQITLNYASSLRFPERFGGSSRIVYLSGEAFFKVKKDAQHPFIVKLPQGYAQDLGTEFDVDAYPSEHYMAVTVTEGKVAFSANNDRGSRVLEKGMRAVYDFNTAEMKSGNDNNTWTGWATGQLSIPDMRMPEIAILLKKCYGKQVSVASSLSEIRFTGEFTDASLEEVVKQIAFVLPCNYKITKDKISFY